MSDEENAFRLAIAADPGDETVRAAYRDWLDDHNDPRGEFIRASEEVHDRYAAGQSYTQIHELFARRSKLLRDHRDLLLGVYRACPWCLDPRSWVPGPSCPRCGDTGRAEHGGILYYGPDDPTRHRLVATFVRGHVAAVTCSWPDLLRPYTRQCTAELHRPLLHDSLWHGRPHCGRCGGTGTETGWEPTAWALRVVRWFPVTEFRVQEAHPLYVDGYYRWRRGYPENDDAPSTADIVPSVVFDAFGDGQLVTLPETDALMFFDPQSADTALSRAAAAFVRSWAAAHPDRIPHD